MALDNALHLDEVTRVTLRGAIERYVRHAVPGFRTVAGAAEMTRIVDEHVQPPACYITPGNVVASSPNTHIRDRQTISRQFNVVICTVNDRGEHGSDAADEAAAYSALVQRALLGWQPHQRFLPMSYQGGAPYLLQHDTYFWRDSYALSCIEHGNSAEREQSLIIRLPDGTALLWDQCAALEQNRETLL